VTLALARSATSPAVPPPRPFAALTALSAALLALALLWSLGESRLVGGDPASMKPAKFALAFVATFGTLALAQSRLSAPWAEGRLLAATAAVMGAAFAGEMAYMTVQAARGEASHFNLSTPFHATMYSLMGVGAVLLTLGIAVVGVAVLRDREARLSPALRRAVGLSFVVTAPLVLATAGWLSAQGGHLVGVHPEGGATVPLLGWSLATGDLRPAHFLALHAMQAIPLWVLARERPGARVGMTEVAGVTALWAALTAAAFAQALLGLPLIRL
jgi:hypothetical protein